MNVMVGSTVNIGSRRGSRNGVAFSCVSFLADPQRVQLCLEGGPVDYFRHSKFISHFVFPLLLTSVRARLRAGKSTRVTLVTPLIMRAQLLNEQPTVRENLPRIAVLNAQSALAAKASAETPQNAVSAVRSTTLLLTNRRSFICAAPNHCFTSALVLVVAAKPAHRLIPFVATLRSAVKDRVVAHQGVSPSGIAGVAMVDGVAFTRERADAVSLGEIAFEARPRRPGCWP